MGGGLRGDRLARGEGPMCALAYDPELGAVEVRDLTDAERKRWGKAENWGPWLAYPEDGSAEFHEVWELKLGQRVRFVARGGRQFGPQHPSVVAATYWAFAHGWRDPSITAEHNVRCITEVRSGGISDDQAGWGGRAS